MGCSYCGEKGHNRTSCPKRRAAEAQASAPKSPSSPGTETGAPTYTASLWEKITTAGVASGIVGLVGVLVIRNEPIADPNLVVILRIVVSLAIAALGATIPGFLHVGWNGRGVTVRATGAAALFLLTYFGSPQVMSPNPPTPQKPPTSNHSKRLEWQTTDVDPAQSPREKERLEGIAKKIRGKRLQDVRDQLVEIRKKNGFNFKGNDSVLYISRDFEAGEPLPTAISLPDRIRAMFLVFGQVQENDIWKNAFERQTEKGEQRVNLEGFRPAGRCFLAIMILPLDNTFFAELKEHKIDALLTSSW